jgi:hypothetical protein
VLEVDMETQRAPTALPPQVMLHMVRAYTVVANAKGEGTTTRTYEKGLNYYVKLDLARELVRTGAAEVPRPVQSIGMAHVDATIDEWLADRENADAPMPLADAPPITAWGRDTPETPTKE